VIEHLLISNNSY